jgi:hypothetical protein
MIGLSATKAEHGLLRCKVMKNINLDSEQKGMGFGSWKT